MPNPSWTDWVTAISTAATVIASGAAGIVALLAYRRDIRSVLPIVEVDLNWIEGDAADGVFLKIDLKIVNRLDETLVLNNAAVVRPKRANLAQEDRTTARGGYQQRIPSKLRATHVRLNWQIQASGAYTTILGPPSRTDLVREPIYIFPPADWPGGIVRVDIWASSKALTIRDKRIVIFRRTPPRPSKATELIAKNIP